MSDKVSGGGVITKTKRVFLVSGTAHTGWWVNYNWDAVNVAAENQTLALASEVRWCDARRVQVEYPSVNNHLHGAGVIDKSSDGVVGPNWINIHEPGSICPISVPSAVCSAGYAGLNCTGQFLTFTIATSTTFGSHQTGQFYAGGLPGIGSAIILNDAVASDLLPIKLPMAELMTGQQSGGVQCYDIISTDTSASTWTWHGLTLITAVTATISSDCVLTVPDGKFIGQKKIFTCTGTATAAALRLESTKFVAPITSINAALTIPALGISAFTVGSAASWAILDWNGSAWVIQVSESCTT